jgi:hypothetical protein
LLAEAGEDSPASKLAGGKAAASRRIPKLRGRLSRGRGTCVAGSSELLGKMPGSRFSYFTGWKFPEFEP